MWSGLGTAFGVLLAFQVGNTTWQVARTFQSSGSSFLISLSFALVILAAIFGLVTVVRNRIYPQPWVNLDTDELRAGRHTVALSRVDRASIPVEPATKNGVLVLRLVAAPEARVEIILRDRRGATLDQTSTAVLAEAVRRTSVAMPTASYDPTGRFARYNFPGRISREDAVALVERPPGPGAPLPAAW